MVSNTNDGNQCLDQRAIALISGLSTIRNVSKKTTIFISCFYSLPFLPQIPHSANCLLSAHKVQQVNPTPHHRSRSIQSKLNIIY